jgi:N,N-dimethylglycine/sarcosine dehydrogenase
VDGQQPADSRFPRLFSPLELGPVTVKNRIVNSAHQTRFAHEGDYTDRLIAYHRERARGGAGVIVSQATGVTADYLDLKNVDGSIVEQYRRVMDAVRPFGARYFVELYHPGRQSEYTGFGAEIYHAPSPVPLQSFGREWRVPHELDGPAIRALIRSFGAAAGRCREGGVDGIELHFAHGNLAEQFMSPVTNRRADEWGGSLENRLRFAREVATAVREAAGTGLAVGCRLTGAVLDPGELTDLDMLEIAGLVDSWGLLDYISVTMGHYSDALNTARNMPDMTFTPGLWARYGKQIKSVVGVPVFLVGRINHPQLAEELLTGGSCDMVVMARALIADAELPLKAAEGRVEDIRPCVGSMNCIRHHDRGQAIACVYNPVAGRELAWGGELEPAAATRRIAVVGAGPAGLECARVARLRGHEVTLLERAAQPGGQVRVAARAPQRAELGEITGWLWRQCEKAGVDIRLGTEATAASLAALSPDAVVVATGSRPRPLALPADGLPVVDCRRLLEAGGGLAGRVVVVDDSGDRQGLSAAQALAENRCEVHLVTTAVYPGIALDSVGWRMTYQRLVELGVRFHPLSRPARLEGSTLVLEHVYAHTEEVVPGVDALVTALAPQAEDALYRALESVVQERHLIGDAMAPRNIEAAVFEGQEVARRL